MWWSCDISIINRACYILTEGDFWMSFSPIVLSNRSKSGNGLTMQDPHNSLMYVEGSGWQPSSKTWSWDTEWVASETGVIFWSCTPRSSRPRRGVPYWTCCGGVWAARLLWKLWAPTAVGVPISSLALGWRKTLSSKSPFSSTLISYSRFKFFLDRENKSWYIENGC